MIELDERSQMRAVRRYFFELYLALLFLFALFIFSHVLLLSGGTAFSHWIITVCFLIVFALWYKCYLLVLMARREIKGGEAVTRDIAIDHILSESVNSGLTGANRTYPSDRLCVLFDSEGNEYRLISDKKTICAPDFDYYRGAEVSVSYLPGSRFILSMTPAEGNSSGSGALVNLESDFSSYFASVSEV